MHDKLATHIYVAKKGFPDIIDMLYTVSLVPKQNLLAKIACLLLKNALNQVMKMAYLSPCVNSFLPLQYASNYLPLKRFLAYNNTDLFSIIGQQFPSV